MCVRCLSSGRSYVRSIELFDNVITLSILPHLLALCFHKTLNACQLPRPFSPTRSLMSHLTHVSNSRIDLAGVPGSHLPQMNTSPSLPKIGTRSPSRDRRDSEDLEHITRPRDVRTPYHESRHSQPELRQRGNLQILTQDLLNFPSFAELRKDFGVGDFPSVTLDGDNTIDV